MSEGLDQLRSALVPLEKALEYARRNENALRSLGGVEELVAAAAGRLRGLSLPENKSRALERLAAYGRAFDAQGLEHRRRAVDGMCAELHTLLSAHEPARSSPAPALPSAAPEQPARGPRIKSLSAEQSLAPVAVEGEVLQRPLSSLRGVGPAVAQRLATRGLHTLGDALLFLPRKHEDRREVTPVGRAGPGRTVLVSAKVVEFRERFAGRPSYELEVADESGTLVLRWYGFKPGQHRAFLPGARVVASGEVRIGYRGRREMAHPDVEVGDGADDPASFGRIVPVYTEIEGVSARFYRRIALQVVGACAGARIDDFYPEDFRRHHGLAPLGEALARVHFPPDDTDFAALSRFSSPHQRRLVFDELFFVQLGLAQRKRGVELERGHVLRVDGEVQARALARLPFAMTGAQRRAFEDVTRDLARGVPMNRLLQGDVGSGKTAVALASALVAVENGFQAAVLAPTELLAEQHFRTFRKLLGGDLVERPRHALPPVHTALMVAGRPAAEARRTRNEVESGTARLVVGTHALLSEGVAFQNLGLAIVDEQHRFGVLQRARLMEKGRKPHVLVMTATPIPRTLALTLYGDLDVSVIDELPPGRTPVVTKAFTAKTRGKAYEMVRREVAQGRQAYVVLPLVEESEKIDLRSAVEEYGRLGREELAGLRLGLVHGRLSAEERSAAMESFRRGGTDVLVATTVIEVGVDVPNASVMVIEHAERFGLSQLHQLRGRVGRGAAKSHCLLVHEDGQASEGARERLAAMVRTSDGFELAEADLRLRGPGEFLGTRQSGLPDLVVADLLRDQGILAEARAAALRLVAEDPRVERPDHAAIARELMRRWAEKLSLARIG